MKNISLIIVMLLLCSGAVSAGWDVDWSGLNINIYEQNFTFMNPWLITWSGTNVSFNETRLNVTIDVRAALLSGDNATWNESRLDGFNTSAEMLLATNSSLWNESRLDGYNTTSEIRTASNYSNWDESRAFSLFALTSQADNATWNESRGKDQYQPIGENLFDQVVNTSSIPVHAGGTLRGNQSALRTETTESAVKWLTGLRNDISGNGDDYVIFGYGGDVSITGGNADVGIGTLVPSNKLNVIGDINATGAIYGPNLAKPTHECVVDINGGGNFTRPDDAIYAGCDNINIKKGDYTINGSLYIEGNLTVICESGARLIMENNFSVKLNHWEIFTNRNRTDEITFSSVQSFKISGCEIDGNRENNVNSGEGFTVGLFCFNCADVSLIDLYVHDVHGAGVIIDDSDTYAERVNAFNNTRCGISFNAFKWLGTQTIVQSTMNRNRWGLCLWSDAITKVSGSEMALNTEDGVKISSVSTENANGSNKILIGNDIRHNLQNGILCIGEGGYYCKHNTFISNLLQNNGATWASVNESGLSEYNTYIANDFWQEIVINNPSLFIDRLGNLNTTYGNFGDVVITNNLISDTIHEVSSQGLQLSMNFNNGSINGNSVLDSSTYNNHGTNNGAVHNLTEGFNGGGAYTFDGASNQDITLTALSRNPKTIAFWMNLSSYTTSALAVPMGGGAGQFLAFFSSGLMRRSDSTGAHDVSAFGLSINTWYHIVEVCNGTGFSVYIDGVKYGGGTNCGTLSFNNIGDAHDGSFDFNGTLDEIKVWDRSLSDDEVKQLYYQRVESTDSCISQKNIYSTNSGNIGIGTVTPANTLNVIGDINTTGIVHGAGGLTINNAGRKLEVSSTGTYIKYDTNDLHRFYTDGVQRASVEDNGLVVGDGASQLNITLTSPNAAEWCCGVNNAGAFSCNSGAC